MSFKNVVISQKLGNITRMNTVIPEGGGYGNGLSRPRHRSGSGYGGLRPGSRPSYGSLIPDRLTSTPGGTTLLQVTE